MAQTIVSCIGTEIIPDSISIKVENQAEYGLLEPHEDSFFDSQLEVKEIDLACEAPLIKTETLIEEHCVVVNPDSLEYDQIEVKPSSISLISSEFLYEYRGIVDKNEQVLVPKLEVINSINDSSECQNEPEIQQNKVKSVNAKKVHQCNICDFSKVKISRTDINSEVKGGHWIFSCEVCTYTTNLKQNLISHIEEIHANKSLKCEGCKFKTRSRCQMRQHIFSKHLKRSMNHAKVKCDLCDYLSSTANLLRRHITRNHTSVIIYSCVQCSFATTTKFQLNNHVNEVHPASADFYKCGKCNYATSREASLMFHIRYRHNESTKHECIQCNYVATGRADLLSHKKEVHWGIKPHKCEICDFSTSFKMALEKHMKTEHAGLGVPTIKHKKKVSSTDPASVTGQNTKLEDIRCPDCNLCFKRKRNMLHHQNSIHLGIITHRCSLCEFTTCHGKGSLIRHKNTKHKDVEDIIVDS